MGKYEDYKEQVLNCSRWLSEHGYFGTLLGTGGNVSVRIEEENAIAITPSAIPYKDISIDDICIVDFDQKQIDGKYAPSVETGIHVAVYKNRLDVNAVIHTHQVFASIFSIIDQRVPALFDEVAFNIGHVIDTIPYDLSGSPELVENVVSKLNNHCNCYIMQNHGALSLGATLERALLNAELLEKLCSIYYYALSTGKEVTALPDSIVDMIKEIRR